MRQAERWRQELARWNVLWLQKEGYSCSENETQASFAWGATITGGKDPNQVTNPFPGYIRTMIQKMEVVETAICESNPP